MVKKSKKTTDKETIDPTAENRQEIANEENPVTDETGTDEQEVKKKNKKSSKKSKSNQEEEQQAKINELNDKFLRLYSEFDNYRKRTSKEKLELAKTASEELIVELLPVLDDFNRALQSTEESKDCDAVKEGMDLIFNKFKGILTKKGLERIESTGAAFDTDFHEAISYIPTPDEEMKGKVIDTVENGYTLGDKVIRYSKVVIGQ